MIMVRVINLSKSDITVKSEVIKAKQIKDFAEDSLSRDDLKTIAAYCASGVAKSYRYEKRDINTVADTIDDEENSDTGKPTTKRSKKK